MVVILTVLLTLTFIAYLITGITCEMWFHNIVPLYFNSKKTLERIIKPGIIIKANDISFYWESSGFGDYKTRWTLLDSVNREKTGLELFFDKSGNITYIESDRWDNNLAVLDKFCHEGLDLEMFNKKR